jgi:hypothetical protein
VYGFALSPDKEQKFLYSVDGPNMWLRILDRQTLRIVDSVGGYGGHQLQGFYHLHSIAAYTDSKGDIYLGEVNEGQRYMRYLYKGMGAPSHPETAAASSGISSVIPWASEQLFQSDYNNISNYLLASAFFCISEKVTLSSQIISPIFHVGFSSKTCRALQGLV